MAHSDIVCACRSMWLSRLLNIEHGCLNRCCKLRNQRLHGAASKENGVLMHLAPAIAVSTWHLHVTKPILQHVAATTSSSSTHRFGTILSDILVSQLCSVPLPIKPAPLPRPCPQGCPWPRTEKGAVKPAVNQTLPHRLRRFELAGGTKKAWRFPGQC